MEGPNSAQETSMLQRQGENSGYAMRLRQFDEQRAQR